MSGILKSEAGSELCPHRDLSSPDSKYIIRNLLSRELGPESSHSWTPLQDLTPKTQTLPIFLCRPMALFLQCQHFIVPAPSPQRLGCGPVANVLSTRQFLRQMLLAEWGPGKVGTHPSMQERYLPGHLWLFWDRFALPYVVPPPPFSSSPFSWLDLSAEGLLEEGVWL